MDAVAFWTNAIDTRTMGLDIVASWRLRGGGWGAADLWTSYHWNETEITDNRNPDFMGTTQAMLIESAQPNRRLGAGADLRFAAGVGLRLGARSIGEVETPFIFEQPTMIEGATIADAEVNLRVADHIRFSLGANNFLDRLPSRLPDDHVAQLWSMDHPSESPYGIAGRVWYVRVEVVGN